jgi:hypothetical protein
MSHCNGSFSEATVIVRSIPDVNPLLPGIHHFQKNYFGNYE